MVHADEGLCADCGGCVGACHVNCIAIAGQGLGEPVRLAIGAACDECNVCVLVCPTGALTSATGPVADWRRR